jgi:hypothetical protein
MNRLAKISLAPRFNAVIAMGAVEKNRLNGFSRLHDGQHPAEAGC